MSEPQKFEQSTLVIYLEATLALVELRELKRGFLVMMMQNRYLLFERNSVEDNIDLVRVTWTQKAVGDLSPDDSPSAVVVKHL